MNLFDDEGDQASQQPQQQEESRLANPGNESFIQSLNFKGPLVWDIETGPVDDERLRQFFEFDPTTIKDFDLIGTEFDESTVKYGAMKDEAKRAAKRDEARSKFEAARSAAEAAMVTAEDQSFAEFKAEAALDAKTARILAIGYMDLATGGWAIDSGGESEDEATLLKTFWGVVSLCRTKGIPMIGFNTSIFDLPVCARRSFFHHVRPVPFLQNGRYVDRMFVDLMETWKCGDYRTWVSLDDLAAFFGLTRKNGDGAFFHVLWHGTPEQREQAVAYLQNDLVMTAELAVALQVVNDQKKGA